MTDKELSLFIAKAHQAQLEGIKQQTDLLGKVLQNIDLTNSLLRGNVARKNPSRILYRYANGAANPVIRYRGQPACGFTLTLMPDEITAGALQFPSCFFSVGKDPAGQDFFGGNGFNASPTPRNNTGTVAEGKMAYFDLREFFVAKITRNNPDAGTPIAGIDGEIGTPGGGDTALEVKLNGFVPCTVEIYKGEFAFTEAIFDFSGGAYSQSVSLTIWGE